MTDTQTVAPLMCLPCGISRQNPGWTHDNCRHIELTGGGRCTCVCPSGRGSVQSAHPSPPPVFLEMP